MKNDKLFWGLALLGYALLVGSIVWLALTARSRALTELTRADAQSDWSQWRDDVRADKAPSGTFDRKVPQSEEPPWLILMRDYFATCLTAAIFFPSLLYAVLVFFARGMLLE